MTIQLHIFAHAYIRQGCIHAACMHAARMHLMQQAPCMHLTGESRMPCMHLRPLLESMRSRVSARSQLSLMGGPSFVVKTAEI